MGVNVTEFESFEQQFLDLIGEFQTITTSESHLREAVRTEATRAESEAAAREAADRAAADARAAAAAAAAGATQAATALARTQEELTAVRMQLDLTERQHKNFEERCMELSLQIATLEREVQQLRPIHANHATLQKQYAELQQRIRVATEEARSEASRLEVELRRVERCAAGGTEIRERARLAAAAHAREKRLAADELRHTSRELRTAHAEISRLSAQVAELRNRLLEQGKNLPAANFNPDEALTELRAVLESEKSGTARLERALAAALADNATLAARLNSTDNDSTPTPTEVIQSPTKDNPNVGPIESFLAD